jgi:glycosyltransferase involved in cell wall biosynthesis
VTLVSFREGPFAEEARAMGLDVRVISSVDPVKAYRALQKLILSEGFDLVHCHGARGNMMGALLKTRLGLPAVTTVHSDYRLDYLGRPLGRFTFGVINKIALRYFDYHIGVSDPVTDMLIDRGFAPDSLFTIYNGLDFSVPRCDFDRSAFLNTCGMQAGPEDVVAGIAARLSPVKDIGTLLEAFARASRDIPRLKLLIAGDGELRSKLERLSVSLGLEGRVCFAGWLSDMDAFYRSIDINLLPPCPKPSRTSSPREPEWAAPPFPPGSEAYPGSSITASTVCCLHPGTRKRSPGICARSRGTNPSGFLWEISSAKRRPASFRLIP